MSVGGAICTYFNKYGACDKQGNARVIHQQFALVRQKQKSASEPFFRGRKMLTITNLKKTFIVDKGEVRAVQNLSLDITDGQFFTLLGPSGSGKSTTLRCIAGLEQPEDGEIHIGGECVYSAQKRILVPPEERPIGMVFQSYAIWPHMDVFHNVAFPLLYGARGKKFSKAEVAKNVSEALAMVQMDGFESRPATQLSGGQQQRVALARALVRKPKLLLLDEPLSNLDAKLRESMRVELKEVARSVGITTFFVTHDQLEALSLSDRIGVIMTGELIEMGSPFEMYVRPKNKLVAEFLGTANSLKGRVVRTGATGAVETDLGLISVDLSAATVHSNESVFVVIRPEGIVCSRQPGGVTDNLFEGTIKRAVFLGNFIDGEVQVKDKTFRALLSPFQTFGPGEKVYVHVPPDRCQVTH
jgi:iron(III) transport system ATP-binding protein